MTLAEPLVLDLERLERQTFGDPFLARELLVLFARQCDRLVPIIVSGADGRARAESAHTLTGAARAVGADRVAAIAAAIEAATSADLAAMTHGLSAAVEEARVAIAARLARGARAPAPTPSPSADASPTRAL